jgi:hypothetical protein
LDEKDNHENRENNENPAGKDADRNKGDRNNKDRQTFDWVTRRSACSLPAVFKELRSQVEQDVNTRNGLRPSYAPYEFSIADHDGGFHVFLKSKDTDKDVQLSVAFILSEHAIQVRDDKSLRMFDVTLSFNEIGECKLKVEGADREFWQVRRMALEELMFRGL